MSSKKCSHSYFLMKNNLRKIPMIPVIEKLISILAHFENLALCLSINET